MYTTIKASKKKKCPGLTRESTGKWWVPIGKNAHDCTYCDYCKQKYKIKDIDILDDKEVLNCNCDSYRIRKNASINFSLFNVSVWSRSLKTTYLLSTKSNSSVRIINVPSGKRIKILIDSDLDKAYAYKVKLILSNVHGMKKELNVTDTYGSNNVYIHKNVLFKSTTNNTTSEIMFIDKPDNIDTNSYSWKLASKNIPDKVKIEIHTYKINKHNFETGTNEYYGKFGLQGDLLLSDSNNKNIPRLFEDSYDCFDENFRPYTVPHLFKYNKITKNPITTEFILKDCSSKQSEITKIYNEHLKNELKIRERVIKKELEQNKWLQLSNESPEIDTKSIELASELSTILELKHCLDQSQSQSQSKSI